MKIPTNKKGKVWSVGYADKKIADHIKKRDNYTCVLCGKRAPEYIIDPSHYWGRYVMSTRFLPENLDAICRGCHFKIENAKQGMYREFKIKQLGKKKYEELQKTYYQSKLTKREAIINLMNFLKNV